MTQLENAWKAIAGLTALGKMSKKEVKVLLFDSTFKEMSSEQAAEFVEDFMKVKDEFLVDEVPKSPEQTVPIYSRGMPWQNKESNTYKFLRLIAKSADIEHPISAEEIIRRLGVPNEKSANSHLNAIATKNMHLVHRLRDKNLVGKDVFMFYPTDVLKRYFEQEEPSVKKDEVVIKENEV